MDTISKTKRSLLMARVKGKHTAPEKAVRSLLHALGYRFRLHKKDLPGRPDICLQKYKAVIFVHGCFWHRHKNCTRATMPSSNVDYWEKKFLRNVLRDKHNKLELVKDGWKILTIWECQIRKPEKLKIRLHKFLGN